MHPDKVCRESVKELTDLPNVGPRIAATLFRISIHQPADLVGRDGLELYQTLCETTGKRYDPCVLDVFVSISRFMAGEAPRSWWDYTSERKRRFPDI